MAYRFLNLVLLIGLGLLTCLTALALPADQAKLEREFPSVDLKEVLIDNPSGATTAETWSGETVKIIATRSGRNEGLDSEVTFEQSRAGALKISVTPSNRDRRIDLKLFIPAKVQLLVTGSREPVIIKGLTIGISVKTESGSITLYLPRASNAQLALRAPRGSINLRLPVTVTGLLDSSQLDGQIGKGGPGVLLNSSQGNISVQPDDTALTVAGEVEPSSAARFLATQLSASNKAFESTAVASRSSKMPAELEIDPDAVKLRTRLVNLNIKVMDQFGRTVPNLGKEDFEVLEDGVRQEITYFEPVTAPVSLVLLIDLSGSIKSKIKAMKKAAKNFVDSLRTEDRIAVAGFTRRFFVVAPFTNDRQGIKKRIDDFKEPGGGTAFYDSLWAALDMFGEIKENRKAVVVLTDGVDSSIEDPGEGSRLEFDELIGRVEEEDVTIYPIYFDTEMEMVVKKQTGTHEDYALARRQLQALSDRTGGEYFKASRIEDLEGVYQKVASELFTLYSIGYLPKDMTDERRWRRVSVKINREGFKAKTRQGYRTH